MNVTEQLGLIRDVVTIFIAIGGIVIAYLRGKARIETRLAMISASIDEKFLKLENANLQRYVTKEDMNALMERIERSLTLLGNDIKEVVTSSAKDRAAESLKLEAWIRRVEDKVENFRERRQGT